MLRALTVCFELYLSLESLCHRSLVTRVVKFMAFGALKNPLVNRRACVWRLRRTQQIQECCRCHCECENLERGWR